MPDTGEMRTLAGADITRIMQLLPHRYPFLLIDRLVELNGEQSGVGIKNVTMNEPFFQGHFPGRPVMPGVLLIECMAQTAGALVLHHLGDDRGIDEGTPQRHLADGIDEARRADLLQHITRGAGEDGREHRVLVVVGCEDEAVGIREG